MTRTRCKDLHQVGLQKVCVQKIGLHKLYIEHNVCANRNCHPGSATHVVRVHWDGNGDERRTGAAGPMELQDGLCLGFRGGGHRPWGHLALPVAHLQIRRGCLSGRCPPRGGARGAARNCRPETGSEIPRRITCPRCRDPARVRAQIFLELARLPPSAWSLPRNGRFRLNG